MLPDAISSTWDKVLKDDGSDTLVGANASPISSCLGYPKCSSPSRNHWHIFRRLDARLSYVHPRCQCKIVFRPTSRKGSYASVTDANSRHAARVVVYLCTRVVVPAGDAASERALLLDACFEGFFRQVGRALYGRIHASAGFRCCSARSHWRCGS